MSANVTREINADAFRFHCFSKIGVFGREAVVWTASGRTRIGGQRKKRGVITGRVLLGLGHEATIEMFAGRSRTFMGTESFRDRTFTPHLSLFACLLDGRLCLLGRRDERVAADCGD